MPVREDSLQTSSAKHPIPQNVMDVEFKVVGDITVRQFMSLVVGGTLAYILFRSGLPTFWRYTLSTITVLSTLSIAFVPLQERTLDIWIINFIKSLLRPSQRLWIKEMNPPLYFSTDYAAIIKNEIITLTPTKSRSKLEEYLSATAPEQKAELDANEDSRLSEIGQFLKTRKPSVNVDLTESSNKKIVPYEELESKQNLADIVLAHNKSVDRALSSANLSANQAIYDVATENATPMGMGGQQNLQSSVDPITLASPQPIAQPVQVINPVAVTNQFQPGMPGSNVSYVDENENKSSLDQIDEDELHRTVDQMKQNLTDSNTNIPPASLGFAHISDAASIQNFPVSPAAPSIPKTINSVKDVNIIRGIVKDKTGLPVEGASVIVINSAGTVEYSLKTDAKGAFISEIPLSNGSYIVECVKSNLSNSTNLKFDIINLVANGSVIPPIMITEKVL